MRILAITFTNKAADEMRERVAALVGPVARKMWVARSTRPACASCGGRPRRRLPVVVLDLRPGRRQRLTGYVIRDLALDPKRFTPKGVHAQISQYKNDLVFAAEARDRAANIFERKIADIFTEYQARLEKAGAMDFDDLLTVTVAPVPEPPRRARAVPGALRAHPGRRVPGHQQGPERADPDPGRPRTATCAWSGTRTRASTGSGAPTSATSSTSRRRSLTSRSSCSSRTTARRRPSSTPPTPSSTTTSAASPSTSGRTRVRVTASSATTPRTRATRPAWVVRTLVDLHDGEGYRWGDMAVFYRTNAQSRVVEEALMRAGIPYKVVGGTRFYDRREIKDALAYLRAVVNPADEVSVKRVLNVPKRGVGDTTVGEAGRLRLRRGRHRSPRRCAGPTRSAWPARRRGASPPSSVAGPARRPRPAGPRGSPPGRTRGQRLPGRAGGRAHRRIGGTAGEPGRAGRVGRGEFTDVAEFMEQVALVADSDEVDGDDSRCDPHDPPHGQGPGVPGGVPGRGRGGDLPAHPGPDRARRAGGGAAAGLRGITRARERLFISHAWSRTCSGRPSTTPPAASLEEIPAELIESIGDRGGPAPAGGAGPATGSASAGAGGTTTRLGPRP